MILGNLLFGFVAIFHLAYLGVMFDSSSHQESVSTHYLGLVATKPVYVVYDKARLKPVSLAMETS